MDRFEGEEMRGPVIAVDTMRSGTHAIDNDEEVVYVGYVPDGAPVAEPPAPAVGDDEAEVGGSDEEPEDDDPFGEEGPRPLAQKIVILAVVVIVLIGGAYLLDYWDVLNTGIVDIINALTGRA